MSKGTSSIPCHPSCRAVTGPMGFPTPSPFEGQHFFPHKVTGHSHVAVAPRRVFAGRLLCTPYHWESVARAGSMPQAPYRGHCSTVGAMPGAGRGHGTASPLGCGAGGTPIPGRAGGTWPGLPWARDRAAPLPAAPPALRGASRTTAAASTAPLLPRRAVVCGAGKLRHGRGAGTRCPPLPPAPGLPGPGAAGSCRGTPLPWGCWGPRHSLGPTPLRLLSPRGGRGARAGWGGEGKGRRWDYGDGTQ